MNDVGKRFGNCICIFVVIFWLSLFICAVLLPLHVEAAESTQYSYFINVTGSGSIDTRDAQNDYGCYCKETGDFIYSDSVTFSSEKEYVLYQLSGNGFKTFALGYFDSDINSIRSYSTVEESDYLRKTTYSINGKQNNYGSSNRNGSFFMGTIDQTDVGRITKLKYDLSTNIKMFDSSESATAYFISGDTSGQIKLPIDIENPDFFDEAYYLKGFKADANINASWTGTSERTNLKDVEVYEYVRCFAGYSYKTSPGQIATRTEIDNEFPITNKSLSLPWADMQHENEDLFLRYIQFAPIYSHSEGIFGAYFYGKSCYIYFNPDGTVEKVVDDNMDLSSSGVFNPNIEIPKIYVDASSYSGGVWLGSSGQPDSLRKFQLSNAAENYFIEMRGRWYSVDDVQLYKENLMWKYKYDSIIKNDLTTWVSVSDAVKATGVHNFADLGRTSFENLLTKYPVDSRNFTGGKNLVGNIISGYNDALSTLKLLLNACESVYNGVEVYVRYYYYDDSGKIVYSKWTHYFDNLANPAGSSGSTVDDKDNIFTDNQSDNGLTDDDVSDLEESDNSRIDPDVVPEYIFETDDITIATQNFFTIIADLIKSMGQVPELVSSVFSFLPNWCITLIGLGLGAIVILRFIGR